MFLNMLDDEEKRAFTLLAEKMIEADGIVVGREAAVLASLKAEMGVGEAEVDLRTSAELAKTFKDKRSRVAALLELYGLAYSDTNFDSNEQTLLFTVAGQMGFGLDEINELEHWVQDHVALVRRAMTLMRD
jgi:cell division GTPase FtsZ